MYRLSARALTTWLVVMEGLTLASTRFHAADQMEQVHYRDEADRSAASIIHPSAISSVSQIPREPVGIGETK